jgi:hypothetical protein
LLQDQAAHQLIDKGLRHRRTGEVDHHLEPLRQEGIDALAFRHGTVSDRTPATPR